MFGSIFSFSLNGFWRTFKSLGLIPYDYIVLAIACIIWFIVSVIQEREEARLRGDEGSKGIVAGKDATADDSTKETGAECRNLIDRAPLPVRWAIYLLGFAAVLVFGVYGPGYDAASFIYRGF